MMRGIVAGMAVAVLVAMAGSPGDASQDIDTQAARGAVEAWLALTDAGEFGESWSEAGTMFRNRITRAQWEMAVAGVRSPLGAVRTRSLKSATASTTLPGAPDGAYVVLQFDTRFERKASAVETVTAVREDDGRWRVVGYFVK